MSDPTSQAPRSVSLVMPAYNEEDGIEAGVAAALSALEASPGEPELLVVDDKLREMILQRKSATEMLEIARRDGMQLMREDGWSKVTKGLTTIEEVARVTKIDIGALE